MNRKVIPLLMSLWAMPALSDNSEPVAIKSLYDSSKQYDAAVVSVSGWLFVSHEGTFLCDHLNVDTTPSCVKLMFKYESKESWKQYADLDQQYVTLAGKVESSELISDVAGRKQTGVKVRVAPSFHKVTEVEQIRLSKGE